MGEPRPLILTAMEMEAVAVRKALSGLPAGRRPRVEVIGIAAVRLGGIELGPPGVDVVILAGLAGGLDPSLRTGEIVVDGDVGVVEGAGWRCAGIHTATDLVTTPADKVALFRSTGAVAVEMEATVVRAAVAKAGSRFVGIRAIAHTADETVDPGLLELIDEAGRPRAGPLAKALLRRPGLLVSLLQLRSTCGVALRALEAAVRVYVEAGCGGAGAGAIGAEGALGIPVARKPSQFARTTKRA
jgi:adenosylhomocysteine nucleosidase